MYDLNKVMLIGRLTKDPEIRTTPSGAKVVTFTLAMTISKNKDTGEQKTEYIDCTAWEGLAEIIEKYVTKGTMIYVEGQLQTRSWEGQDGKKNYKTEVLAKDMKILSSKGSGDGGSSYSAPQQSNSTPRPAAKPATNDTPAPDTGNELPEIDLDEIVTPF
ncbi:MAG: hypothetical protein OHK0017_05990 [Patescibacteria group bacterium]